MLTSPWRSVLWSGAFLLIMMSLITPFSIFMVSFAVIPILFLYLTLEQQSFLIHCGIMIAILFVIGSWVLPLLALFFIIPAVIMGVMYRRQYPAHLVLVATAIAFIAELLLAFLVAASLGFTMTSGAETMMKDGFIMMQDFLPQNVTADEMIFTMTQMIPAYMIFLATYFTIITHWLGRKLFRRIAIDLPGLPPLRTWMLPRSVVWLYVGVLLFALFFNPQTSTMFTMVLYNLLPLLQIVFCIQAVSFLFFLAHHRGWGKGLPITGIVACFFIATLMSILGVFDIMLDLRSRIQGNKQH